MSKSVSVNIEELKVFLDFIITCNKKLQLSGKKPTAIEVEGESGFGKTSTIEQLAKEKGMHFVKINLAQIEELGDLVGFPIKKYEVVKAESITSISNPDPIVKWVDEVVLEDFRKEGYTITGKSQMSYAIPEWIVGKEEGGILCLDDYNRADQRFLAATMELIDRQEYISWKLPKNWHVILTCNPDNGDYLVQSMDSAQKTRYIRTVLKFDSKCWAKWAESEGIDGRCINFLIMNPEVVTKDVNARSITTFFNAISTIDNFGDNLGLIQQIGEGSVGGEFATLFTTFINHKLDKLISPEEMLIGKRDHDLIIAELKRTIGTGETYRADIASVLCTRFVNYTLHYSQENPIDTKILERTIKILTSEILSNDIKYYMAREIVNGNKSKFQSLLRSPEIISMVTK